MKTTQINLFDMLFLTQKLRNIDIRKFSIFSLKFRLFLDMDFVENRNCAQNLAFKVAREAAEILTLDSYFIYH